MSQASILQAAPEAVLPVNLLLVEDQAADMLGAGRTVSLRVEETPEGARLVVRDRGIGIEPKFLPRVFERFERGVSDRHYGGLGLFITRQVVEALGGCISVESQPGQGATFTVELPREASAGSPAGGSR